MCAYMGVADRLCVLQLQVKGEAFVPWRAPRLRMPRRTGSRLKKARSPPRSVQEESPSRGGEETASDDATMERRTKQCHDPRYAARTRKVKAAACTPPKRKRMVVALSSGEEDENPHSSPEEDDDLQHDFRYVPPPVHVHSG